MGGWVVGEVGGVGEVGEVGEGWVESVRWVG